MRCYFCCNNPFFEVLFHNPCAPYIQHAQGSGKCPGWKTVPTTASRVAFRVVKVGSKLLISLRSLEAIIPNFSISSQEHVLIKWRASNKENSRRSGKRRRRRKDVHESSKLGDAMSRMTPRMLMMRKQMSCMLPSEDKDHQAGEEDDFDMEGMLRDNMVKCYLNVTSLLNCADGLVCVAISCSTKVSHAIVSYGMVHSTFTVGGHVTQTVCHDSLY